MVGDEADGADEDVGDSPRGQVGEVVVFVRPAPGLAGGLLALYR